MTAGNEVDRRVAELSRALEREIEREARPLVGCWPLLTGVAGILLAVALLLREC